MSILAEIIEHKKTEIAALDAHSLRRAAESSPSPRDFLAALTLLLLGEGPGVRSGVRLIAELKRASPPKASSPRTSTSSRLPRSTSKTVPLRLASSQMKNSSWGNSKLFVNYDLNVK